MDPTEQIVHELNYIKVRIDEVYNKLSQKADSSDLNEIEARLRNTEQAIAKQTFIGLIITGILSIFAWSSNRTH